MNNDFYNDEFEELLKEKADQFSMYPSKRVWHSIYNNLHPGRRWPSLAIGMILITSLLLIGHLNTGEYKINPQANNAEVIKTQKLNYNQQKSDSKIENLNYAKTQHKPVIIYGKAFEDVITNETDFYTYTVVRNNRPFNFFATAPPVAADLKTPAENISAVVNKGTDIVQSVNLYIKTNQIFADITTFKSQKTNIASEPVRNNKPGIPQGENKINESLITASLNKPVINTADNDLNKLTQVKDKTKIIITDVVDKNDKANEEKAWIENFAFSNKKGGSKFKGRLAYQFYATPAVNYRKLTTRSKGSATPFANADINEVISQKPGLGIETGLGLTYAVAKRLQVKAGLQFNYTNYNIDANRTNHPVTTTILLNDPVTGFSYPASRTSTTSNTFDASALQPVTLHNRTYQISVPVGFAYNISSEKNVDWFAGATIQPTYVFGGKAHLLSADLKSYVSDPSSIRTWNLNLGFETYMNFKLKENYSLQVGPQVRYQVYSTYRKDVALIEKPYAVGLKLGLTKGF